MAEQFIDDNLDPIVPIPKENIILLDSGQPVNNTGTGNYSSKGVNIIRDILTQQEADRIATLTAPLRELKDTRINKDFAIMDSISGTQTQVVFEFPTNDIHKSMYIYMPDMITVSHSVSRAKIPVTSLGETTVSGLGLGTKMVAGSIVKLFSREDKITKYIKAFVEQRYENLNTQKVATLYDVNTNSIPFKEVIDYMRDDIAPFNIHLISMSEYVALEGMNDRAVDSIIGCTIINTGKVSSIENLITEETISFMAQSVVYHKDINRTEKSVKGEGITTGTSLLRKMGRMV